MIVRVRRQGAGKAEEKLPPAPGSYLLVLRLPAPERLPIGALGDQDFAPGTYLYCGSALGPGGVRARVRRHLEGARPLHWHIDYLLRRARVQAVWVRTGTRRLECEWAAALSRNDAFTCPAPRFGASDCRCRSHLWRCGLNTAGLETAARGLPLAPRLLWRAGAPQDILEGK